MTPPEDSPFESVLSSFQLGESETFLKLATLEHFIQAEQQLLQQVRRKLFILTPHLEPDRYSDARFVDAISRVVRRSRFSDVRVLVGNPDFAIRDGHRLVNLSHRLPSQLRLRRLHDDDFNTVQKQQEAWIVADDIGLLRRDGTDAYRGMLAAKSIPGAQRASQLFIEMWERSREIKDFRPLDI